MTGAKIEWSNGPSTGGVVTELVGTVKEFPRFTVNIIRSRSGRATAYYLGDRLVPKIGEYGNRRRHFDRVADLKKYAAEMLEKEVNFVHPNTALLIKISELTGGDIEAFEAFVRHIDKRFSDYEKLLNILDSRIDDLTSRLDRI